MSEIIDTVNRFRAALLSSDRALRLQMTRRWLDVETALAPQVEALVMEIAQLPTPLTNYQLTKLSRYRALLEQIVDQLTRYGTSAVPVIEERQRQLANMARDHAVGMVAAQDDAVVGMIDRINLPAVENMIGAVGDGSPLRSVLLDANRAGADAFGQELVNGIALGLNPREVARRAMRRGLGQTYLRSVTIARTETMRVYREATRMNYQNSGGIVTGYRRIASKSRRTCLGCLAADGMVYSLETEFDSHPNCRCTLIPILSGRAAPSWTTGQQWFETQSPAVQRDMLGNGMYQLWESGRVDFGELWRRVENPTWGNAIVPARLRDFADR